MLFSHFHFMSIFAIYLRKFTVCLGKFMHCNNFSCLLTFQLHSYTYVGTLVTFLLSTVFLDPINHLNDC